jgi:hypothetical protein
LATSTAAGLSLIVSAVWFNVWFAVLAQRFDYPDILRRPTDEILARFRAGGSSLILTWWAFMLSGWLLVVSVVLVSRALGNDSPTVSLVALVVGVLAGLVQALRGHSHSSALHRVVPVAHRTRARAHHLRPPAVRPTTFDARAGSATSTR